MGAVEEKLDSEGIADVDWPTDGAAVTVVVDAMDVVEADGVK